MVTEDPEFSLICQKPGGYIQLPGFGVDSPG